MSDSTLTPTAYLARSSDTDALRRSASGGAFWELALAVLKDGGVVCGCAWDEDMVARHIVVSDVSGLMRLQGSKYMRSRLDGAMEQCLDAALSGKKVLFSGTPCQCKGFAHLAKRKLPVRLENNVLIVALICHGTAKPEVWRSYKGWLERKYDGRLVTVNFRDKSGGYSSSQCSYEFLREDGSKVEVKWPTYLRDRFIYATIVYDLGLESSCYKCNSKGLAQPFDLIIGDWYEACEDDGVLGSSCIIALSEKGDALFLRVFPEPQRLDIDWVVSKNQPLVKSVVEPSNNADFCAAIESSASFPRVERYFPKQYWLKSFLVKIGLFDFLKKYFLK